MEEPALICNCHLALINWHFGNDQLVKRLVLETDTWHDLQLAFGIDQLAFGIDQLVKRLVLETDTWHDLQLAN